MLAIECFKRLFAVGGSARLKLFVLQLLLEEVDVEDIVTTYCFYENYSL